MLDMSSADDYGGQDLRHEIVQNTIPGMVLAVLAVVARFSARRTQRGAVAWHDWFVVLGLIGSLLQSALVLNGEKDLAVYSSAQLLISRIGATEGIGLHIKFVSNESLRRIFIVRV